MLPRMPQHDYAYGLLLLYHVTSYGVPQHLMDFTTHPLCSLDPTVADIIGQNQYVDTSS